MTLSGTPSNPAPGSAIGYAVLNQMSLYPMIQLLCEEEFWDENPDKRIYYHDDEKKKKISFSTRTEKHLNVNAHF